MSAHSRRRLAFVTDSLFGAYQSELRKAFERAALRSGYDVLVVVGRRLEHTDPAERAQNAVYDWLTPESVDGAVLLSSTLMNFAGSSALEGLVARLGAVPTVSIGAPLLRVPSITVDNRAGMRTAVDHLIEVHECRRIGYLAGPSDNCEGKARLEGYRYALEAHFLPFDQSLVEHGPFNRAGGAAAMQKLLERGRVFDAIVTANDALAVGAREILNTRHLAVPQRVRLIAFDDSPVAVSELLSSVAQPFNQLAVQALEALEAVIDGRLVRDIAFCPRLALRESCGCGDANRRTELPALSKGQSVSEYLAAERSTLVERLQEINAACFDWWSMRGERLLLGVEAAVSGKEREFLSTVDELVAEALEDGVPVEQIGRSIARLQHHFQGAEQAASLDHVWSLALKQLRSALGETELKRRVEGIARSSALRDATLSLWAAGDERQLAERLASGLARMGVKRAYLALLGGAQHDRLRPCLQVDDSGSVHLDGPIHAVGQLLPGGFLSATTPSAWLVGAVNFGSQVTGIWACDGGTDALVFEQLRTDIGAVLQLLSLRRALAIEPSGVPRPRRANTTGLSPRHPDSLPPGMAPAEEEETRIFTGEAALEPATGSARGRA